MLYKDKIENLKSEIHYLIFIEKNEENEDIIYEAVDGLGNLLKAIEDGRIILERESETND